MQNELGPKGSGPKDVNTGISKPETFEQYAARLGVDLQLGMGPKRVIDRLRDKWMRETQATKPLNGDSVVPATQAGNSNIDDSARQRMYFHEYEEKVLGRIAGRVGGVPRSVIAIVKDHWSSGEWNDQSGTGDTAIITGE